MTEKFGRLALHMWTSEVGPGAWGAGIWQSGGGIVSDGSNGMFVSTGNGVTPPVGLAGELRIRSLEFGVMRFSVSSAENAKLFSSRIGTGIGRAPVNSIIER